MTSDNSSDKKPPHAMTVRFWGIEFIGQGFGIVGLVVLLVVVVLICKPDIGRLIEHVRPSAKIADASK